MINPNNYYMVQGWMLTELQLKGNALAVYAIIYGFSQDGSSEFSGSARYLGEWLGCSKKTVLSTLAALTELGHLTKKTTSRNGVTFCTYSANRPPQIDAEPCGEETTPPEKNLHQGGEKITPPPEKNLHQGGEKITPNNTRYNSSNKNIEKNIGIQEETPAPPPPPLPSPKKEKQVKHKHGEYKNVLLTDEELDNLKSEFSDWETRIDRLSSYIASTGKAYKSHYVTIKNWARRDAETGYQGKKTQAPTQTFVPGAAEKYAIERLQRERLKKFREELRTAGNDPEIAARAETLKQQLGG